MLYEVITAENFFLFGMQVEEVEALWAAGYRPWDIYNQNESLRNAIDLIASGYFSDGDPDLFRPLVDSLLRNNFV